MTLLVWSSACGGPATRIVVVVDSEIALGSVHARSGNPGCTGCEHDFALGGDGAVSIPFSFVLTPRGGDASREVVLFVEGRDAGGTAIAARTVRTGFRAGRTVLLRVVLDAACAPAAGCEDVVDPATLPEVEPGRELERDAAVPHDAGDAGDPGTPDGGDAGTLPRTCAEAASLGMGEGLITIAPEGGSGPIAVFCENDDDGGGWTLLAVVPAGSTDLAYTSSLWTATTADAFGANDPTTEADSLQLAYHAVPVSALRIQMVGSDTMVRTLVTSVAGGPLTLRSAMAMRASLDASVGTWTGLLPAAIPTGSCAVSGLDVQMGNARARIGALIGDVMTCSASARARAWIGVAAEATATGPCDPSSIAAGGVDVLCGMGPVEQPARAIVWGR